MSDSPFFVLFSGCCGVGPIECRVSVPRSCSAADIRNIAGRRKSFRLLSGPGTGSKENGRLWAAICFPALARKEGRGRESAVRKANPFVKPSAEPNSFELCRGEKRTKEVQRFFAAVCFPAMFGGRSGWRSGCKEKRKRGGDKPGSLGIFRYGKMSAIR